MIIAYGLGDWVTMISVGTTAAATVVLALVTYRYMNLTRQATDSANRSAEASERAAAAAAESVELTRQVLLLDSIPFVTGAEVSRSGQDWTLHLTNQGGGTAINSMAWIEVEGVAYTAEDNRILPPARYTGPIEKGSTTKLLAKGPILVPDGTDVAVVVRYTDKAGGIWETANHRFGPNAGKVDTSLAGARDPNALAPAPIGD